MEQVGARARHRAPTTFDPAGQYVSAGFLLIFAAGMALAGAWDAHRVHDDGWSVFLLIMALAASGIYFWQVLCLLKWLNPSDD